MKLLYLSLCFLVFSTFTTSAQLRLQVAGEGRIDGDYLQIAKKNDASRFIQLQTDAAALDIMGINSDLYIDADANLILGANQADRIGLGTANPQRWLHAEGDAIRISTPGNGNRFLEMRTDGDNLDIQGAGGDLYINSDPTENILLATGSNNAWVGIGKEVPDGKLHVSGDRLILSASNDDNKIIEMRTDGAAVDLQSTNADLFLRAPSKNIVMQSIGGDGNLYFGSGNNWFYLNGRLRMGGNTDGGGWRVGINGAFIQRNGNVGFGVGSGNLGVGIGNGTANIHLLQSSNATDGEGGMKFQEATSEKYWKMLHDGNHLTLVEYDLNAVTQRAQVEAGTGDYIQPSDRRLKSQIRPLHNILDKFLQLRPVTYRYRQTKNNPTLGLIAQEVREVFPEVVRENTSGELALSYKDFTILAISAIQEQQALIDDKDEMISNLQAALAELEVRLARLEQVTNAPSSDDPVLPVESEENGGRAGWLKQNQPNPFSGKSTIAFYIPKETKQAAIKVYGLSGELVRTLRIAERGLGDYTFSSEGLPAGVLPFVLELDGNIIDQKTMVIANSRRD